MKNQVLSREQMQELIDMGIDVSNASMYISEYGELISNVKICELGLDWTPTFTLQDILEMLPKHIFKKKHQYSLILLAEDTALLYKSLSDGPSLCVRCYPTILEAAFQMLKWCKENKYI